MIKMPSLCFLIISVNTVKNVGHILVGVFFFLCSLSNVQLHKQSGEQSKN